MQSPSNDYNLRASRGLSAFDFRRRWLNPLLYELPIGKGKVLLGHASHANRHQPQPAKGEPGSESVVQLAAFVDQLAAAPQYRYGNSGRNTITGPGIVDMDFSVIKYWRFSERQGLEFRAEFFNLNLPNHPFWSLPGASPGANTYGQIASTVIDSRQLQFGLKYSF